MESEPKRKLNSANRVVDILEAFAFENSVWSVSDLARRLKMSKAAAHAILANLESRLFLEKDEETSRYSVGTRLWEIGVKFASANKLPEICDKWLRQLRDRSAESCYLAVYDHGEVLYIGKAESENPVQAYALLGSRAPSHCTASGKVLLAAQSELEISRVLGEPLTTFAPATVTDPSALLRIIEKTRSDGFATSDGEWRGEVTSIAVPVVFDTRLTAAICITGPTYRFDMECALGFAPVLMRAAEEIRDHTFRMRTERTKNSHI